MGRIADTELWAGVSSELQERDDLSGIIPPIALWDLPCWMRGAVLGGRMLVGSMVHRNLYESLFGKRGITLTEADGEWLFEYEDGEKGGVGALHVAAIRLGSVIGALSPTSVVEVLSEAILGTDG